MWIHLPEKYARIIQKHQERERTTAEHFGEVERWFIDLELTIQDLRIRPQNLWNFDKTGFIVGQGKDEAAKIYKCHVKDANRLINAVMVICENP